MNGLEHPGRRFAVDIMLGKLAKWLRVLGFDARSMPLNRSRIDVLLSEGVIPVTRTEKFRDIEGLIFIDRDRHFDQLKELIALLRINAGDLRPFSRCSLCNATLLELKKEAALGIVPDYIFETAPHFHRCPTCARVYWPGSHRQDMIDKLENLGIEGLKNSGFFEVKDPGI